MINFFKHNVVHEILL